MTTQEILNISGAKRKLNVDESRLNRPVKKLKFEKTEKIKLCKGDGDTSHCLEVFVFSQLRPTPDILILQKLRALTDKGRLSQKRIAKLIGARYVQCFIHLFKKHLF